MNRLVLYTIVCSLEIDIEHNKISEESALGKAVLGKVWVMYFQSPPPGGVTTKTACAMTTKIISRL